MFMIGYTYSGVYIQFNIDRLDGTVILVAFLLMFISTFIEKEQHYTMPKTRQELDERLDAHLNRELYDRISAKLDTEIQTHKPHESRPEQEK